MLTRILALPLLRSSLAVGGMLAFSFLLLVIRIYKTGKVTYVFLTWNAVLALAPLAVAYLLRFAFANRLSNPLAILLAITWLLFLPNAPYIITDFVHVKARHGVPIWYDILLVFSFAISGLLAGFISLRLVHLLLLEKFNEAVAWLAISACLLASGYAIYLGRFLRLNSWHVVTQPAEIFAIVFEHFSQPLDHFHVLAVTALMFTFLIGFYLFLLNFREGSDLST